MRRRADNTPGYGEGTAQVKCRVRAYTNEYTIIVRAILGLFNTFCILSFRNGVARAFGRSAANWYVLLQASQFHMMYYVSRPLSNFFAFGLSKFERAINKFIRMLIQSSHSSSTEFIISIFRYSKIAKTSWL